MGCKPLAHVPSVVVLALSIGLLAGCVQQKPKLNPLVECQNQVLKLKDENAKLKKDLLEAQLTIDNQTRQLARLQGVTTTQLAQLTHVKSIQIDRLTSQYDGGIAVYLQPVDEDGHIIKAAGTATVKLFELQGEPHVVGEVTLKPEGLEKAWIGRFWTNHYTIRVPFAKRPATSNVTVHVEFTELLTGKVFVAEKLVEVKLKPTTVPATTPTKM